jgi:hypothetical protein
MPSEDLSIINRCSSKNRRIPILRDKPIRLIKWWKVRLENLLVSPYLKRRIRRRAIRDYHIDEYQNSPYSFNVAPTSVQIRVDEINHDFHLKVSNLMPCPSDAILNKFNVIIVQLFAYKLLTPYANYNPFLLR